MKGGKQPVILVKKKRSSHAQASHGGSWKIAYADFMTAMMAFFLVMWLLAIASPQELTRIAEYFRTPLKVALSGGQRSSDSFSPIPGGGDDVTRKEGEVRKFAADPDPKTRTDQMRLKRLRERLEQLILSDPRLKLLRPHLMINMTDEGLRIQIVDSQKRPMFKNGSAQVEPYMRYILRAIAPILNELPNKISLSGHTDDLPYANGEKGYSNWELSADRANASRRELMAGGLDSNKILRVVGMADTMNLHNMAGNAAENRRISILVLNKATQDRIEREDAEGGDAIDMRQPTVPEQWQRIGAASGQPAVTPLIPTPTPMAPMNDHVKIPSAIDKR
ncbi:flagellar motor protein MotB [Edwardsiella ictaluri]|uniref:Flagellar motor protein MotB n=1 Tax=Edwardsiella ictaluri TaxID=67780 RepID=A0ABY8GEJ5_EDWIC|nr:flagellar motor protein MotB [Edwardsiella ictaluri]ELV7526397.1 flagellar motor protein MotB [Edwardsiella ictaluri]KMQ78423.1 flagellar motor protein MotB [Edwardsiella ictaluri]KOO55272.1 flagellar motor protein MotB [Edwardsiella ictaluri]QPW29748.1 flagellar motor protein MotB [Edwardsiella ictaluri]UYB62872.1 flagellar motor protein MotB [Edwardsiella ictaluri]